MNLAEFHFIRPYWLLAVLPYLGLVALMLRNKLSLGNWSSVCDAALLPFLLQEKAVQQSRWPLVVGATGALLLIIALAGPTWQRLPSPVFRNESALVIALDLSRSMDAGDIKPTRLTMARYKITDILKKRKDGQTALIVYAGDAFTVTPLTNDTDTIQSQLEALTTDIMPSQGSNTVLVLNKAVELFKQAGLQKGQILLMTDGADVGKTLSTVNKLGDYSLFILGIGTAEGAPIALPEGGFLKDTQGSIVVPKLNAGELAQLAQAGHGVYQTLTSTDQDIQALLASIDVPAEQQGKENTDLKLDQWEEKGPWLVLLVLPLAALLFRRGLICFALLLILPAVPKTSYAFEWQDLWQSKDQQAQAAYNKQQYEQAAEQFNKSDWKAAANYKAGLYDKALESVKSTQTANQAYNQGNALAQSGQLEPALKAYEKALSINPNDEDAKYNKELVEKELEKQKQQQQQKDQKDKKDDKRQSKEDEEKQQDQQKSEQQKQQEKKQQEEQQKAEQKPEQKEEGKPQDQQQQADQKEPEKQEEKKPEPQKAEQAQENKEEDKTKKEAAHAQPKDTKPTDEKQQANEQWLNRIPDDPAGLLRRKFKYQYGQREHPTEDNADAW